MEDAKLTKLHEDMSAAMSSRGFRGGLGRGVGGTGGLKIAGLKQAKKELSAHNAAVKGLTAGEVYMVGTFRFVREGFDAATDSKKTAFDVDSDSDSGSKGKKRARTAGGSGAAGAFRLKDAINRIVKEAPDQEMTLKDARKKVFKLYRTSVGEEAAVGTSVFKGMFAAKVASSSKVALEGKVLRVVAGKAKKAKKAKKGGEAAAAKEAVVVAPPVKKTKKEKKEKKAKKAVVEKVAEVANEAVVEVESAKKAKKEKKEEKKKKQKKKKKA